VRKVEVARCTLGGASFVRLIRHGRSRPVPLRYTDAKNPSVERSASLLIGLPTDRPNRTGSCCGPSPWEVGWEVGGVGRSEEDRKVDLGYRHVEGPSSSGGCPWDVAPSEADPFRGRPLEVEVGVGMRSTFEADLRGREVEQGSRWKGRLTLSEVDLLDIGRSKWADLRMVVSGRRP
jgi:hypothetical protein